jgi:hypothetical protein
LLLSQVLTQAALLSDPAVDSYNARVGTETFSGLYKFTTNTLLVETAEAITNLGSDTIKFYMGQNTAGQSGIPLPANVTNLLTLARDEPSYHRVLDMPFRHFIAWAYPLSDPDAPFQDGNYTATEQAKDYREMYDLTCYLLTNYSHSGKTFYLGHWEGDGYLSVNNWQTNPSAAVVSAMITWENVRQQAVDDAKAATSFNNVSVYYYAEANRVRDAMNNGPTNNVRMINAVIPYVTNLDYVSYSSYDAQNLSAADLYTTLNYMQAHLPANKAGVVPGERMWIGEYGWGYLSPDAQEPLSRAYIQRLLGWNSEGHCLQYILFWEIYNNQAPSTGATNFFLIDPGGNKVASYYLHQRFLNRAKLLTAQFKESNGRLPSETEFASLVMPMLSQPLPAPVSLSVANGNLVAINTNSATVSGTLTQGIYGDEAGAVWLYYGRQDGGTGRDAWEQRQLLGVNTNFNPAIFTTALANLAPQTNYYYRFYATNSSGEAWAPVSSTFSTVVVDLTTFGSRMKISFAGYTRGEPLEKFPVLVNLGPSRPGFDYRQFASPTGADLRFTDATGSQPLFHEIDEWNTNGTSTVWVQVPLLSSTNDFIWAYWGNPAAAASPAPSSTSGAVWSPGYQLVWHLKESGFPFKDSAQHHPALTGIVPASTSGFIGRGCSFDGTSQFLDAGIISLGDAFTLSAWVNIASSAANIQTLWANQKGGFGSAGFAFYVDTYPNTDQKMDFSSGDGSAGHEATTAAGTVRFAQWHLLTASVNRTNGSVEFFLDGTDVQSGTAVAGFANNAEVNFGRFTNANFYFKGIMDEARIEYGTRSPNWVWANWMTVAANNTFANYSPITRQAPVVALNTSGTTPVLSWPASGVGFALYSATNLASPAAWSLVPSQPALVNNQWQLPLPANTNGVQFYRLQSQ